MIYNIKTVATVKIFLKGIFKMNINRKKIFLFVFAIIVIPISVTFLPPYIFCYITHTRFEWFNLWGTCISSISSALIALSGVYLTVKETRRIQKENSEDANNKVLTERNERLKKELENQKETKIGDNVQKIGRWLDNRPGSDTQLFLNKDLDSNKYYLIHKYSDGSTSKDEVQVTKEKGLVRFQEINTNHIEWYIIEKNGDLSMYSQSGKFATALCF